MIKYLALGLFLLVSISYAQEKVQNEQFHKDPQNPYKYTLKQYEAGTKALKCEQEAMNYIAGANLARMGVKPVFISVTRAQSEEWENSNEEPKLPGIPIIELESLEPALATLIMDEMLVGYHAYEEQIKTHPQMKDNPPNWNRIGKQKYDACMSGTDA